MFSYAQPDPLSHLDCKPPEMPDKIFTYQSVKLFFKEWCYASHSVLLHAHAYLCLFVSRGAIKTICYALEKNIVNSKLFLCDSWHCWENPAFQESVH